MTADAWSGSIGLLNRMNFAQALVAGQVNGVKVDANAVGSQTVRRTVVDLLGYEPAPDLIAAIEEGGGATAPAKTIAAVIGSPDFQKR
jgi:hypothetical protein